MKVALSGPVVADSYIPQYNELVVDTVTGDEYWGKQITPVSSLVASSMESEIWIPATDFVASAAGAALEVVDAIHHGFLLDGSATENISTATFIPAGWNNVLLTYYGYNATADAGGICLGVYVEDNADGASLVSETPTAVADVVFTAGAEDTMDINVGTTTIAVTPSAYHSIKIARIQDNAGDTKTGDWGFLGVRISKVN